MSGVMIDTCIWSLALRGKTPRNRQVAEVLTTLIEGKSCQDYRFNQTRSFIWL